MKEIVKHEATGKKGKRKKSKKGKETDEGAGAGDGFHVDTADARFAALYRDARYAVDPTDARYKDTAAMRALMAERAKGRGRGLDRGKEDGAKDEPRDQPPGPGAGSRKGGDVRVMVDAIKRRSHALGPAGTKKHKH
jgi:hypothetical protein